MKLLVYDCIRLTLMTRIVLTWRFLLFSNFLRKYPLPNYDGLEHRDADEGASDHENEAGEVSTTSVEKHDDDKGKYTVLLFVCV